MHNEELQKLLDMLVEVWWRALELVSLNGNSNNTGLKWPTFLVVTNSEDANTESQLPWLSSHDADSWLDPCVTLFSSRSALPEAKSPQSAAAPAPAQPSSSTRSSKPVQNSLLYRADRPRPPPRPFGVRNEDPSRTNSAASTFIKFSGLKRSLCLST
ncbi:hypothetical protein MHYP_G00301300 [Metynnis hypsauchen]